MVTAGMTLISATARATTPPSQTIFLNGLAGYAGNESAYMVTNVGPNSYSDNLSISLYSLHGFNATVSNNTQNSADSFTKNVLAISSGTNYLWDGYESGGVNSLIIHVPVAVVGGAQCGVANPPPQVYQNISMSVSKAPSNVQTTVDYADNVGFNSSTPGTSYAGQNLTKAISNLILYGASFLPGVGYLTGGATVVSNAITIVDALTGKGYENGSSSPQWPIMSGSGVICEEFQTNGGNYSALNPNSWQNIFSSGTNLTITIPVSDFSAPIHFSLRGRNYIGYNDPGFPGVMTWFNFSALPAVEIAGTVKLSGTGAPLADQTVNLEYDTFSNGILLRDIYQVETNQLGQYRFFAQPEVNYTINASLSTSFGTAYSTSTTINTSSAGGVKYVNLNVPATVIKGYISYSGGPLSGATVTASVNGNSASTSSGSNGYYQLLVNAAGTYSMQASHSNYYLLF